MTPTLDRPEQLRDAVQSVLKQTFTDWSMVVYDVGDTPASVPDDPRISLHRGPRKGPAADFQAALELARGEIVTPLADDDLLPPHALLTCHEAIGDADWLVGRTVLVDQQGEPAAIRGGTWDSVQETRRGMYWLGGAVYWRRTLTGQLGGFDSAYDGAADFDLYRRFIHHSMPAVSPHIMYIHNIHPGQDTVVNQDRQSDATRRIMARA